MESSRGETLNDQPRKRRRVAKKTHQPLIRQFRSKFSDGWLILVWNSSARPVGLFVEKEDVAGNLVRDRFLIFELRDAFL